MEDTHNMGVVIEFYTDSEQRQPDPDDGQCPVLDRLSVNTNTVKVIKHCQQRFVYVKMAYLYKQTP